MIDGKKILAIIPAREGSVRLVNKNILPMASKPLIQWTIISAKKSKYIDDIVISTDSKKIIDLVKKISSNLLLIKRPKYLSLSTTKSESVVFHTLKYVKKKTLFDYDYFILLQPTSPLRHFKLIDKALMLYRINKNINSLVSVSKNYSKLNNKVSIKKNGFIKKITKTENKLSKSNQISINGSIYLGNIKDFLKVQNFFLDNCLPFLMQKTYSIDIDTINDFKNAEKKLSLSYIKKFYD
tara:strand:+ start:822 stop:1538 length:717 start_codon:yes stop_codon:yes gene_type:complete